MKLARLLLAGACCACASQPRSPFFGDDRYLVVGVDPHAEADTLAQQLEQNGYRIVRRLRGQHFTALGAAGPDGDAGKVRVVTARGIALALDSTPGDPLRPAVRHALLQPPSGESHDADGDGFEEVFVQTSIGAEGACILAFRVRDSGFVDEVAGYGLPPLRDAAPPWDAPHFCEAEQEPQGDSPQRPQADSPQEP